jgi:hypothetical protein
MAGKLEVTLMTIEHVEKSANCFITVKKSGIKLPYQ